MAPAGDGAGHGAQLPASPGERRALARAEVLKQRRQLAHRLAAVMPQAMRERPQWLLWKLVDRGGPKKAKVPYYVNGQLRGWPKGRPSDGKPTEQRPQVDQAHPLDHEHLATLDEALQRYEQGMQWEGVGFAFLPGDGLIGVDVDHAIGPDGQPSDLCRLVVESLSSYTELSPSGTGVHVIVAGEATTFKDDKLGVEVYAGLRYFTCTGLRCSGGVWPETPEQVQPADPTAMAYLHELVMQSRTEQAAQRAADAKAAAAAVPAVVDAAARAPSPTPTPSAPRPAAGAAPASGGDDFKRVNDAALGALQAWVPALLSEARQSGTGYRVTSKDLGRDLQEDLSIKPEGIVDYGVADMGDARQGKRTAIDLVLEYGHRVGVTKPAEALRWLANTLGIALARPALRRVPAAGRAAAAPAGGDDEGPGFVGLDDLVREADREAAGRVAAEHPQGKGEGGGQADDAPDDDAPSGRGRKHKDKDIKRADELTERFALVYGSDTAWDRQRLMLVRVPMMRLFFGKAPVNIWLAREWRQSVMPEDLVFEPGEPVADHQINMFGGLDLVPELATAEDVAPMLDLLRHLCADTIIAGSTQPVADAMHWVLSWQALPLQHVGTKMATACVMHGAQGTGKNLYWDAWRDLFGSYGVTVTQTELEDKYNGWISRKLAIVGDEVVSRQELYHNKNRLKLVVTQGTKFAIRGMFMETRWESNHANVVFLSNENTPLVLEDLDRRYMVTFTPLAADPALYQRVREFLATGGLAKWMGYLQAYDIGDFTAHTKPPMTKAKEALIEASWRSPARFAYEWLEGYIDLPVRVCSVEQLYRAFRRWCDLTGAKWPPEQSVFTTELNRWVRERVRRGEDGRMSEPELEYKPVALQGEDGAGLSVTRRKTVRCFLPRGTGMPEEWRRLPGVSIGAWAWDSIKAFEDDLRKYCRRPGATDDEGAQ